MKPHEYDLHLIDLLTKNGFTLQEVGHVLNDLRDDTPLGEAISRVYFCRNLQKESHEPLSNDVFNDPVAF